MEKWDERFGPLRLQLALLKEKAAYRTFFADQKGASREKFAKEVHERFGIDLDRLPSESFTFEEVLGYLDPAVEGAGVGYDACCHHLFFEPAIFAPSRLEYRVAEDGRMQLIGKPSERLLIVDLSRKNKDLVEAFAAWLKKCRLDRSLAIEATNLGELYPSAENYTEWDLDGSRDRTEKAWQHLEVWKLRRKRKGFPEIARALGMNLPTVKMAFYKAHEMIEGRLYEREKYKREHWNLRECSTCPDNSDRGGTCIDLCPDLVELAGKGASPTKSHENFEQIESAIQADRWYTREARELQTKEDEE